jgi:hypothetical protein
MLARQFSRRVSRPDGGYNQGDDRLGDGDNGAIVEATTEQQSVTALPRAGVALAHIMSRGGSSGVACAAEEEAQAAL